VIGRYLSLMPEDRALVLRAAFLVSFVRACLWVLPYRTVRRLLAQPVEARQSDYPSSRIAWAISSVSRYVPGATCLTQALAAESLLRFYGYEPSLHIGVAKNSSRALEAHAWIDVQGTTIVGNVGVERFTPLKPRRGLS
jgi:Transglutaminase-like superfamily